MLRRGAAGVGIGLAATLVASGIGAVPSSAATSHSPRGSFHITMKGLHAHVWGVASDPDSGPVRLMVSQAGRPDFVIKSRAGNHAYAEWIQLRPGQHRITVRALNHGAGHNRILGSNVVSAIDPATYNPRGGSFTVHHGAHMTFAGHVVDPSAPRRSVRLNLWHDGKLFRVLHSNPRTHAFATRVALHDGRNYFRLVAVNTGSGTANLRLGSYQVFNGYAWVQKYTGNRRIAAEMLPSYGWGEDQMRILDHMWYLESHWLAYAANPSGAYGIPQAYPGYKMASAGADWRTNARTQIKWGLDYIRARYGSPSGAWYSRQTTGNY